MNGKKWMKIFTLFSFSCILLVSAINYTIDPFNIFHTKILKHQFQMNERFIKIEYLEKHNKEFNGYLFGSSRIGTTPPSVIEKYIPNSKIYNFTIDGANIYDYITHLKYFIEHKYPIETLYLQLDINNMNFFGRSASDYLRKLHPYILNQSLILYYMSYLNGLFPFNIKGKILKNINHTDGRSHFLDIGIWTEPDKEKAIIEDCKKYQQSVAGFNIKVNRTIQHRKENQNLVALQDIKKLCEDNNIKLYLFTTPHNKNMMDSFNVDEYLRYLKDISNILDFYDFSGYNTITMNNCNYYEHSHYRPLVGSIIAGRIFNDKSIKVPDDFGIYITKDNIDTHLKKLREQIKNYDLNKTLFE